MLLMVLVIATYNLSLIWLPLLLVGIDFEGQSLTLNFTSTSPEACFAFTLIDDNGYEQREDFFVNLTSTDPAITVLPNYRIIQIVDDDGK